MTRINLIDPRFLTNRHLMAEYREIQHVPYQLERSLKSRDISNIKIPKNFTLNAGHVMFFYDKGRYLHDRFYHLRHELLNRDFKLQLNSRFKSNIFVDNNLYNYWTPEYEDIKLVCKRIDERIKEKPDLYSDKSRFLRYYNEIRFCPFFLQIKIDTTREMDDENSPQNRLSSFMNQNIGYMRYDHLFTYDDYEVILIKFKNEESMNFFKIAMQGNYEPV